MKSLKFIERLNFKRIAVIYAIISVLLLVTSFAVSSYLLKDKINLWQDYRSISKMMKQEGITDSFKGQLNQMVSDSNDVKNAFVVDKSNDIVFKSNNNVIGEINKFELLPYASYKRVFQDANNPNVIYKVIKGREVLFDGGFVNKLKKHDDSWELYDDFSYVEDLTAKEVNLLNYVIDRKTGNKVFIIRSVDPFNQTERVLETAGFILIPIFILYWLGLALWVYKDANQKQTNAPLWGLLVLLTNLAGLAIYLMVKQSKKACYQCGVLQNKENTYCANCGTQMGKFCSSCNNSVNKNDLFCGKCGNKLA